MKLMSIGNAIKFIRTVEIDDSFRKALYRIEGGWNGLNYFLQQRDLNYSPDEFEEAFNYLHAKCVVEEQADKLFNVRHLVKLVTNEV